MEYVTVQRNAGYSTRAWVVYAAIGIVALVVYLLLPTHELQRAFFCLFPGSAAVAICMAVRSHRPARGHSWLLLAAGLATINLGNMLWAWFLITTGEIPFPSAADAAFVTGYVVVGISLLTLFRGRVSGGDRNGLIDATIVTVGLGMVSWVLFMQPLQQAGLSPGELLVALAFPLLDVLLLGVAARLFLSGGSRPVGLRFLAVAIGVTLMADIVNGILSMTGVYQHSVFVDAGWATGFLAFGAFALHPTMHLAGATLTTAIRPLRNSRVLLLAAATLMAPLVMVIQAVRGEPVDVAVVAPASVVLFVLVLSRLITVVRDLKAALGEREALESQLTFQALHDPLTALANRRLFTERFAAAIAARRDPALIFLDLDDFKSVNDSYGHAAGDGVLLAVAERLREAIRPTDTPARLGGDEFGILLLDCPTSEGAEIVARRLLGAMEAPVLVEGRATQLGMSIGIALSDEGALDVSELLRNADIAMYLAKTQGKGRYALYGPAMGVDVVDRERPRDDLQAGLGHGEIEPHYQPIVDIRTGDIRGVEALARWRHPERGLLMPAEFIPLAESTGLILPLGTAMMNRAVADAVGWPEGPAGPLALHLNLSVHQLRAPGLVALVEDVLGASGLAPARLVFEVTESLLMGDAEIAMLGELKALGVRLAIDDFGTGYSSLGYLRRLPVDAIKLDRSFVAPLGLDRRAAEISRLVIQMAAVLDLDVVAEGIENESQRIRLAGLGCQSGQGFLFSKALPEKELRVLMARWAAGSAGPDSPGTAPVGKRSGRKLTLVGRSAA